MQNLNAMTRVIMFSPERNSPKMMLLWSYWKFPENGQIKVLNWIWWDFSIKVGQKVGHLLIIEFLGGGDPWNPLFKRYCRFFATLCF